MAAARPRKMTEEEYLAVERAAVDRSEFRDGEMVPVPVTGWNHNLVKANVVAELGRRFRGGPYYTLSTTMRTKVVATGLLTYPDVLVMAGPADLDGGGDDVLLNPTAIVEVLSDRTEEYDRGLKFRHYRRIPVLREYVLVGSEVPAVDRFVRRADDTWAHSVVVGLDAEFAFATVPARVKLSDLYAGVVFPAQPEG